MSKKSNAYKLIKENEIIDRILTAMQNPVAWQKTWEHFSGQINRSSLKSYQWINAFILAYEKFDQEYTSSQRLTFKQAKQLGWYVKKWSESVTCKKYSIVDKKDKNGEVVIGDDGKPEKMCFVRYFNVFNLDCIEWVEPHEWELKQNDPIEHVELVIDSYMKNNDVTLTYDWSWSCYYQVKEDKINMVKKELFDSSESFYHTFLHEMSHSTWHPKRLARKKTINDTNKFGDHKYCVEELVAEFSAAMTAAAIWLPVFVDNVAGYLSSRADGIKKSNRQKDVTRAISMAKRSCDFILWENK